MKILNSYKKIAKEFIKEAEVDDDKIIKYKDKEGESQEMTAGAAKKQPEDHPAKQAYNKMKGDGDSGDKPKGKALGGSDFDRDFDDEPTDKGDDKPKDSDRMPTSDSGIDSNFSEDELAEEPFPADDYDEDMEMEITDELVDYFVANANKEAMKDYTDEEMQEFVLRQSEKLIAKYQQPDGVPNEERNMKSYRDELISNIRSELGYEDGEAGFDADDDGGPSGDEEPKKISSDEKVINGKKYKAIKESKEPTKPTIHSFKETYKKIGGK